CYTCYGTCFILGHWFTNWFHPCKLYITRSIWVLDWLNFRTICWYNNFILPLPLYTKTIQNESSIIIELSFHLINGPENKSFAKQILLQTHTRSSEHLSLFHESIS